MLVVLSLAPADEPQDFTWTDITSTSATLTWSPPTTLNGIIIAYTLAYEGETVTIHGQTLTYTVSNLNEHTGYTFSIQAQTRIGPGPAAMLTLKTAQDGNENESG